MFSVLNGNLIVLIWQNIHATSNLKYTAIYTKTRPSSLLYIQQRRIQNPFKRLSKKITSLEVTIFTESSILNVWKGSQHANAQETTKQSNHIRQRPTLRQATYVYLITGKPLKNTYNGIKWTTSKNLPAKLALPSSLINNLIFIYY